MSDATHPFRRATEESPAARWAMIAVAVGGLALLVGAPLVIVFAEALSHGWAAAVASLASRDAQSAIRLTLLITAIAVPLNAVFGIALLLISFAMLLAINLIQIWSRRRIGHV